MPKAIPIRYEESIEEVGTNPKLTAEPVADPAQQELFAGGYPAIVSQYPQLPFMGNKFRPLPWIHKILSGLSFVTAIDAFSGSGCVSYLLKAMGKQVSTNDFMNLGTTISKALIENPGIPLSQKSLETLLTYDPRPLKDEHGL